MISSTNNQPDFVYITTPSELTHWFNTDSYFSGAPLALDCETCVRQEYRTSKGSALDPFTGEIALIIVKERSKQPLVIDLFLLKQDPSYFKELVPLLISKIYGADYLLGANLKFDLKFLKSDLGVWFNKVFDVVIASQLIYNATGSKVGRQLGSGYADICRELLNVHISGKKDERLSDWGIGNDGRTLTNEWWANKIKYAANDVKYLFYIEDIQRPVLTNPLPHTSLLETYNHVAETKSWGLGMSFSLDLEMEVVPVIAKMEYNGMPTGPKMMGVYQSAVHEKLLDTAAYLAEELNLEQTTFNLEGKKRVPNKVLNKLRSPAGLLLIINEALNLKKIDNTQSEVLKRLGDLIDTLAALEDASPESLAELFVDNDEAELYEELMDMESSDLVNLSPIVKKILEFKKLTKQDGMDLRKYINQVTKRIHANYSQLGAATGRLSCIAEGQKVMIPGGWKNIEAVQVGDYVYCYSDDGKPAIKQVLNSWCEGIKDLVKITWRNAGTAQTEKTGTLLCTPDHRIKTADRDWVEAENLIVGEQVYHLSIDTSRAYTNRSIVSVRPAGRSLVYNLEIEDFHNFVVSGIVVANCSGPNLQQQSGRTLLEVSIPLEDLFT